mgnify:CR=1 FL=1
MKHFCNLISAYARAMLASFAEFGAQDTIPGLTAAADLSAAGKQYIAVRMAGANTVNIASEVGGVSGVNKMGVGVLQNLPKSGETATVAYHGLSKVRGGGAVTGNALITYNSSGMFIDAVSGDVVMGRALETATTAGEIVTALLFPPVRWSSVA